MRTSEAAKAKIKEFEGLRLRAYKPVATEKYYTIGYGHSGPDVGASMVIDEAKADALLYVDLTKVEKQIEGLGLVLGQNKFDALVSFVFNLGIGNLKGSTLLKKIKAGAPTAEIQAQFMRWVYAGGKVLAGLEKRRKWEAAVWAM